MKFCVTGASGLIGSYVVKLLKESGDYVRAVVHRREPNAFTRLADEVEWGDLGEPDGARHAVRGCDIVLSCAGITGGIGIVKIDPVSYVGPATAITVNTLHAAHLEGVKSFGYLSSTTVYSAREELCVEGALGPAPYPLYAGIGWSKRFLEQLCAYYSEKTGIATAIVRPSGAYGRFDNFDEGTSHVLPGLINRALALKPGEPFTLWGDGMDVRDIVHAEDVARGLILATKETAVRSSLAPFNIASGWAVTTWQLAEAVLAAVGSKAQIVCDPSKPSALKVRRVSIERARRELGFEPRWSLRDGIADTIAWLRQREAQ